MKLIKPENENYAAVVVKLNGTHKLEGLDNLVGATFLGFQALINNDTPEGQLGIVFPAETQLSEEFARKNNLHRHSNLNDDSGAAGYLEDNRRVRAIRLRGHTSSCLFLPLSSLSYIKGFSPDGLAEGDTFDRIGDHEICKKYVVKRKIGVNRVEKNKVKFVRVDSKFLPEHYDSDNYFRNRDHVPSDCPVVVTQKLHGTSIRIGNTVVSRRPTIRDRVASLFGVKVQKTEYDYVFGSRKVIKDANNPNQNHYYTDDIWTEEGKKLDGLIPEGYVVYGELIGYTPGGAPIQRGYTYQVPGSECRLYVYRVATVNPQGFVCDLSWDQTKEFCRDRGLTHVPELWRGQHGDFVAEDWMDKKYNEWGYFHAVSLDKESPCDEGVCIRVDGIAPYILKAKSPRFFEHETKMLDMEAEDLEAEQSANPDNN